MNQKSLKKEKMLAYGITIILTATSLAWVLPIVFVLLNSFKDKGSIALDTFSAPTSETFVGFTNYINGVNQGNYNFWTCVLYSVIITVLSVGLILICTSMSAWYISRVNSRFAKIVYALCTFSMIVPFQMVQFSLSNTANLLHLDTPFTIPIVYLGFGAGMAIFMFTLGLTCIGIIREILANGSIFDVNIPLLNNFHITLFGLAPGAFFVLACLVAIMSIVRKNLEAKGKKLAPASGCLGGDCASCSVSDCKEKKGEEE